MALLREGLVEFQSPTGGRVIFHPDSVVCLDQVGSESENLKPPGPWVLISLTSGVSHYVTASYATVLARIKWRFPKESAEEIDK